MTTANWFHYHAKSIKVNFAMIPDFPEQGKIMIEPGSQAEEMVAFQRYPQRIYLKKPLQDSHSLGTAVEFASYMKYVLSEPLVANQNRILLELGYLLPARGSLYFRDTHGKIDIVGYRKLPQRVILNKPCRFHHTRGERVTISSILNKK
jgi:hypothetical protein